MLSPHHFLSFFFHSFFPLYPIILNDDDNDKVMMVLSPLRLTGLGPTHSLNVAALERSFLLINVTLVMLFSIRPTN